MLPKHLTLNSLQAVKLNLPTRATHFASAVTKLLAETLDSVPEHYWAVALLYLHGMEYPFTLVSPTREGLLIFETHRTSPEKELIIIPPELASVKIVVERIPEADSPRIGFRQDQAPELAQHLDSLSKQAEDWRRDQQEE
jgi:hypothetical protein